MHFEKHRDIIIKQSRERQQKVGIDDTEGPPVPIPNTEVKLSGAEDTWLETARENREMPTYKSDRPIGRSFFYAKIKSLQMRLCCGIIYKVE